MTEIEKMFENVGIKKQYCGWLDMGDLDCQPKYVRCNSITEWKDAVFSSRFGESEEAPEHKYPPLTAEKQLELIKILMKQEDFSWTITQQGKNTEYAFYVGYEYSSEGFKEFTEALAGIINNLWQSLTDQEKEEIRNILNENN